MKAIDLDKLYRVSGKKALELEAELHAFSRMLNGHFELKYFFGDPSVPSANKKKMFRKILPKASKLFRSLINLLIDNGLIKSTALISEKFTNIVADRMNIDLVDVISAHPLSEEEVKMVREKLGRTARIRMGIDKGLIGGLKVMWSDGRYADMSLSGQLDSMKESILA